MSRPTVEVADILHAQGDRFVEKNRSWLGIQRLTVLRAITRCRTAALGGHVDACPRCGHQAISYNSCRNRHCPKCQAQARQRWLAAREREVLGVPYFHVVFTIPHELIPLCQYHPEILYNLLFQASAATLLEVAADPKHQGAQIGFFEHPAHLGTKPSAPSTRALRDSSRRIFLRSYPLGPSPVCLLSAGEGAQPRVSREVRCRATASLPPEETPLPWRPRRTAEPKRFAAFLRTVYRQDWVVYAKPAFGGPTQVLRYLGRYTHRVAISNHRLLAFDGERVTFRWKDYAHGGKQRKMTLHATEFLRRFAQHILPRGFVRIRQYGFLANRCRAASLAMGRQLLAVTPEAPEPCPDAAGNSSGWRCPRCGATMQIGSNLTARELANRCKFFDSS